ARYRLHVERKDSRAALADLDAVLALPGLDPAAGARARRYRGHILFGRDLKGALEEYNRAAALAPEDPDTYRWRGEALLKLRRFGEAARDFDLHVKLGGQPDARVYHGRAVALAQAGDHAGAILDFTRALGLQPGDARLYLDRGQTYLATESWGLAAKDFDQAVALGKGSAQKACRTLAEAYHGRGPARR